MDHGDYRRERRYDPARGWGGRRLGSVWDLYAVDAVAAEERRAKLLHDGNASGVTYWTRSPSAKHSEKGRPHEHKTQVSAALGIAVGTAGRSSDCNRMVG